MLAEKTETVNFETLDSFISKEEDYIISHKARFTAFQHRSKVEFLRFFVV